MDPRAPGTGLRTMNEDWPYISAALIKKLDEACPERCAEPSESTSEIHHYAGKRALVNFLTRIHQEQNNKDNEL